MYKCGVLTISDTCNEDNSKDKSGLIIINELKYLKDFSISEYMIIPDGINAISNVLVKWCDIMKYHLILTNGGTGLTSTDVTPEATSAIITKAIPGISQMILTESMKYTKFACLSRGVSGIRGKTLIINLPGSPNAVKECFDIIQPILRHSIDQIQNNIKDVKSLHQNMQFSSQIKTSISTSLNDVANRSRESPFKVLSINKAHIILDEIINVLPIKSIKTQDSLNWVVAEDVVSKCNVPPYDASIKDGYCVLYSDGAGRRFVVDSSNAGDTASKTMSPGECVRVSTGAKIAQGSDSVVQVEDTTVNALLDNGAELTVEILKAPSKPGQDIRGCGNDLRTGQLIINSSQIVTSAEIAVAAMAGVTHLNCVAKPTVAIVSTGNELSSIDDNNPSKQIFDCNRPLLLSLLDKYNFEKIDLGIVKDEPQLLLDAFVEALKVADVIITTGSVSMGEKDYIKLVLERDLGATIHFGRVFMKPGKPTTFSSICSSLTENTTKYIFSLPGNPVSAFVTFHIFVLPYLRKMAGWKHYQNQWYFATLKENMTDVLTLDERPEFKRCKVLRERTGNDNTYKYMVSCAEFGNQMSSRLISCVGAQGLVYIPSRQPDINVLPVGSLVEFMEI